MRWPILLVLGGLWGAVVGWLIAAAIQESRSAEGATTPMAGTAECTYRTTVVTGPDGARRYEQFPVCRAYTGDSETSDDPKTIVGNIAYDQLVEGDVAAALKVVGSIKSQDSVKDSIRSNVISRIIRERLMPVHKEMPVEVGRADDDPTLGGDINKQAARISDHRQRLRQIVLLFATEAVLSGAAPTGGLEVLGSMTHNDPALLANVDKNLDFMQTITDGMLKRFEAAKRKLAENGDTAWVGRMRQFAVSIQEKVLRAEAFRQLAQIQKKFDPDGAKKTLAQAGGLVSGQAVIDADGPPSSWSLKEIWTVLGAVFGAPLLIFVTPILTSAGKRTDRRIKKTLKSRRDRKVAEPERLLSKSR